MKNTKISTPTKLEPSLKADKIGQALLIAGCMRSGTSIMGSLLGSLKEVEYFFEPAFLHKVLFKLGEISPEIWKELFEAYVYDELLLNALAGRNLNFNSHDGSHIYRRKSPEEIAHRLKKSFGRLELQELAKEFIPAFKLPDLIFQTKWLRSWYPNQKLLFMYRNPNDTLNSLLRKGWNSDEQLHVSSPEPMRDFSIVGDMRVPRWVGLEDQQTWLASDELSRCAYYYCHINQALIQHIQQVFVVNYDHFINHPAEVLQQICQQWELHPGELTPDILSSIQLQESPREQVLDQLAPNYRQEVDAISHFFSTYTGTNYLNSL